MVLNILRGAFILLAASVTSSYIVSFQIDMAQQNRSVSFGTVAVMLGATLGVAMAIIAVDMYIRKKRLSAISGVFLGLVAGLLAAYALSFPIQLYGVLTAPEVTASRPEIAIDSLQFNALGATLQDQIRERWNTYNTQIEQRAAYMNLLEGVKVFIGLTTCYVAISLVLQTKDDFRFVIPYVEFAKQIRGSRPTLLDTSVIIDGRILDILETSVLQGGLIVPKFVLNELQTIADSSDKLRRARGRRGLDILNKLQKGSAIDVTIEDTDAEGATVDQKLVSLAREVNARVMTNDFNLNKICTLRGIEVINLNELAKALRPVVLPGERMTTKIIKPGEGATQGVGYLEDGTMVVVEQARDQIGEEIELIVTSTLQTSAGRMIFGRRDGEK